MEVRRFRVRPYGRNEREISRCPIVGRPRHAQWVGTLRTHGAFFVSIRLNNAIVCTNIFLNIVECGKRYNKFYFILSLFRD